MPKIPHGSGLDGRAEGTEYLREKGFGHWEVREGVTSHGGFKVESGIGPMQDFPRREHGWREGTVVAPPPSGDCSIGKWDFSLACQSGQVLTSGF